MKTNTKKIRSQQHLFLMLLPLKVIPTLQQVTPTFASPTSPVRLLRPFDDLLEIESSLLLLTIERLLLHRLYRLKIPTARPLVSTLRFFTITVTATSPPVTAINPLTTNLSLVPTRVLHRRPPLADHVLQLEMVNFVVPIKLFSLLIKLTLPD
jgi:hypothetical protein